MRRVTARFATTHIDRHGDRMLLSALESWAESTSQQYLPVIYNHDPRTPPIGRIVSANIVPLSDGEYALEGDIELFEPGDRFADAPDSRSIPLRTYRPGKLELAFDKNYEDEVDQNMIEEICDLLGSEPRYEVRKALDPISILTIGGLFLLHNISSEFFRRLGSDGYDLFKQKLKVLMSRRKKGENDKLLRFDFLVKNQEHLFNVEIIMTNPKGEDIESFLADGIEQLDRMLDRYYCAELNMRRLTFEYKDGAMKCCFAIRQDGIPMFPQEPGTEQSTK